jgi:hypothetical protein
VNKYEPRKIREPRRMRDWKVRLDARLSTCPGCDQWCFDSICFTCTESGYRKKAA